MTSIFLCNKKHSWELAMLTYLFFLVWKVLVRSARGQDLFCDPCCEPPQARKVALGSHTSVSLEEPWLSVHWVGLLGRSRKEQERMKVELQRWAACPCPSSSQEWMHQWKRAQGWGWALGSCDSRCYLRDGSAFVGVESHWDS